MNKKLLMSFLIGLPMSMFAQSVMEPVIETGKTWQMNRLSASGTQLYEEMKLSERHAFNGSTFMRAYSRLCLADGTPTGDWVATAMLFGENGGQVVMIDLTDDRNPQVRYLMDFNLSAGECVDLQNNAGTMVVTAVSDTILENSTDRTERRCLYVHSIENPQIEDVWVEGVGSLNYGIMGMSHAATAEQRLLRCKKGAETIFEMDGMTTTAVESPETALSATTTFYDLQGRRVVGKPKSGIYIRGGRKQAVRR